MYNSNGIKMSKITKKYSGWVTTMEAHGCKARIMYTKKLEVGEKPHGLPPGMELPVYPTNILSAAPEHWVREVGSYICPIEPQWAFWFDWTENDKLNTCVVPSARGMNPITSLKLDDLSLESYEDKCPKHGINFGHNRFCDSCGYEWPPQNYVAAPNKLWWDGFKQPDGTVRQFFFTEDEQRDIAKLVLGRDADIPAFGFAFYKTKEERVPPPTRGITFRSAQSFIQPSETYLDYHSHFLVQQPNIGENPDSGNFTTCVSGSSEQNLVSSNSAEPRGFKKMRKGRASRRVSVDSKVSTQEVKAVSVGGGAQINQELIKDTLSLSDWRDEPTGQIRIYFCFAQEFENMVREGGINLKSTQGYLSGLPLG